MIERVSLCLCCRGVTLSEGDVRAGAQARIEEVGQALMWRAEEAAQGLQTLRLPRRRRAAQSACSGDGYEEHMLLPDDRVALLTNVGACRGPILD